MNTRANNIVVAYNQLVYLIVVFVKGVKPGHLTTEQPRDGKDAKASWRTKLKESASEKRRMDNRMDTLTNIF
jgi:hypothetical protein